MWILLLFASLVLSVYAQECAGPPPINVNPQQCCNHPKLVEDNVFINCIKDMQRPRRQADFPYPHHCIGDCVFKSLNLIVDNQIDERSFLSYIANSMATTPEWIPILTNGFNECNKELSIRSNDFKAIQGDCLIGPGFLLSCLHSQVIKSCPQNVWSNSRDCAELKNFITRCPFPPKN